MLLVWGAEDLGFARAWVGEKRSEGISSLPFDKLTASIANSHMWKGERNVRRRIPVREPTYFRVSMVIQSPSSYTSENIATSKASQFEARKGFRF
jgi:hypothetical protein